MRGKSKKKKKKMVSEANRAEVWGGKRVEVGGAPPPFLLPSPPHGSLRSPIFLLFMCNTFFPHSGAWLSPQATVNEVKKTTTLLQLIMQIFCTVLTLLTVKLEILQ